MGWSVAWIYVRTCQLMMLQLLRASHEEIVNRLTGFAGYFPRAAALVKHLLGAEADMMRMRDAMRRGRPRSRLSFRPTRSTRTGTSAETLCTR